MFVAGLVLMFDERIGGAGAPTGDDQSRPVAGRAGLAALGARADARAERLEGAAAWKLLEDKVIAKHRRAWDAALKVKEARGWKKTGVVVGVRTRQKTGVGTTQAQAFDLGDGLLIEWQWDCGPSSVCGTYYYESYYFGSSLTYDAEFVPTGDFDGYSPWASYVAGYAGSDTRRQRQALAAAHPELRLARRGLGAQDANCPRDLYYWRQCMKGCIEERHASSLKAAGIAAGTSLLACLGKMKAGTLAMMGLTYGGCVVAGSAGAALMAFGYNFGWQEPCDGPSYCGPNPC